MNLNLSKESVGFGDVRTNDNEALRLEDGKFLIVISPDATQRLVKDYALRWGIETLFGIFKTRGFCLESTHLN